MLFGQSMKMDFRARGYKVVYKLQKVCTSPQDLAI